MTSPEDFVKDWIEKSSRAQRGLVQHWQEDMNRNQELADVMRGIVQERSRPFKGERGRSKCQGRSDIQSCSLQKMKSIVLHTETDSLN